MNTIRLAWMEKFRPCVSDKWLFNGTNCVKFESFVCLLLTTCAVTSHWIIALQHKSQLDLVIANFSINFKKNTFMVLLFCYWWKLKYKQRNHAKPHDMCMKFSFLLFWKPIAQVLSMSRVKENSAIWRYLDLSWHCWNGKMCRTINNIDVLILTPLYCAPFKGLSLKIIMTAEQQISRITRNTLKAQLGMTFNSIAVAINQFFVFLSRQFKVNRVRRTRNRWWAISNQRFFREQPKK